MPFAGGRPDLGSDHEDLLAESFGFPGRQRRMPLFLVPRQLRIDLGAAAKIGGSDTLLEASPVGPCDCHTRTVTPLEPTWAAATGWSTVEDWVEAQLGARWGVAEGADYDQEGLCAEVRGVVSGNLPTGWTLDENRFVGPAPISEGTLGIIRDTIDGIDFWGMAQYFDNGD